MKGLLWTVVLLRAAHPAVIGNATEQCVLHILQKYFTNESILLVDKSRRANTPHTDLLPRMETNDGRDFLWRITDIGNWTVQIFTGNERKHSMDVTKVKTCIMFLSSKASSSGHALNKEMDSLVKNPYWDPTGRNLFVVNATDSQQTDEALARMIIEKVWRKRKATDNLVMVGRKEGIRFYSWFPYRKPDCGEVKRVSHLDSFERNRFRWGNNLFPKKIQKDLDGCELIAVSDQCEPYVFLENENSTDFVDGLEVHLNNALAKEIHFTLKTIKEDNMWATTVEGSAAGAFKLLVDQEIDMAFSCLMLNHERYLLAQPLPAYLDDELTWFVPTPRRRSFIAIIFFAFSLESWLMIATVLAVCAFVTVLLSHQPFRWDVNYSIGLVVKLVGMALYLPVFIQTRKTTLRLFLIVFTFYSMHIANDFQASLFTLYRSSPYNRKFASPKQAVDAGMLVYLSPTTEDIYNQSDHALWNKILQPGRFFYIDDFGEAFSQIADEKTAIGLYIKITSIYLIAKYFTDKYGSPQVLWLKESFSRYPVTTYLSPGHPLYDILQVRIHRIVASGLAQYWLKNSFLRRTTYKEQVKKTYENRPLSLNHLNGPFIMLTILLTFCLLAFLFELVLYHFFEKKKKKEWTKPHAYRRFPDLDRTATKAF